jgi:hypothetical protein
MAVRPPLYLEPPPPVPGTGPCRADKFLDLGGFCPDRAARRVVVGMAPAVGVCFWHSLQAVEQVGAHLVRDLPASRKPRFLVFPHTPLTGAHR